LTFVSKAMSVASPPVPTTSMSALQMALYVS
jgi:hypothetical protein